MRIGEFSEKTGISIDTLRYYEKEGLIKPERDFNDRRCYSESDIKWMEFIKRLKETNMPLREIKRYAKLRSEGSDTLSERLELLKAHRNELNGRIDSLIQNREKLDEKIAFYEKQTGK